MATLCPDRAFNYPDQLIEWFHDQRFAVTEKHAVYRALTASARAGNSTELARALVLRGVRPGLDHARRRVMLALRDEGRTHIDSDEVTNAFFAAITFQLEQRNFADVANVAGALVNRIRKQALHALRGGRPGMRNHLDAQEVGLAASDAETTAVDDADALQTLTSQLASVVTPATLALLLAVKVEGMTCLEAAGRFGISHDAARTRVSSALKTIRERLPDLASQFGLELLPLRTDNTSEPRE